jgi:hypothetical protein
MNYKIQKGRKNCRNIQCPVLVCEAGQDRFFVGQPQLLATANSGNNVSNILEEEGNPCRNKMVGASTEPASRLASKSA